MTQQNLDAVLQAYNYAETITMPIPDSPLKVTVAEAHMLRNRDYAKLMSQILQRPDREGDENTLTEDEQMELFCKTCLRGWSTDIPIEQAMGVFTHKEDDEDRRGLLLFRACHLFAHAHSLFKREPGKKKRSQKSGTAEKRSAPSPSRSKTKQKPAAARSRPKSKST